MLDGADILTHIAIGFTLAGGGWWSMYAISCTFRAFRLPADPA